MPSAPCYLLMLGMKTTGRIRLAVWFVCPRCDMTWQTWCKGAHAASTCRYHPITVPVNLYSAAPVAAACTPQSFCAGVGNWVADEVLWQSRLHPEQLTSALEPQHVQALHTALQQVVQTAVAVQADSSRFPPDWMFHVRWVCTCIVRITAHGAGCGTDTIYFHQQQQQVQQCN